MYFAEASNDEKQAVMKIIKPMPCMELSEVGDTVRLLDIVFNLPYQQFYLYIKKMFVYQDLKACVNSFKLGQYLAATIYFLDNTDVYSGEVIIE